MGVQSIQIAVHHIQFLGCLGPIQGPARASVIFAKNMFQTERTINLSTVTSSFGVLFVDIYTAERTL